MNRKLAIFVALAALTSTAPAAVASWYDAGNYEPNTRYDVEYGLMYNGPDQDPDAGVKKVYFNAFETMSATSANPNTASAGSRVLPVGALNWEAHLGVWKDCNRDGFIGMADGAVLEYRVELLPANHVCPLGSIHNNGSWVAEYRAIGMVDPCEYQNTTYRAQNCGAIGGFGSNPIVIYSNDTYVWGDQGRPDGAPGSSCALNPRPRGFTSNTGTAIKYFDCILSYRIASTVNAIDPDGDLRLKFEDPQNPQRSSSLLNQNLPVSTFGNPTNGQTGILQSGTGRPAFTTWDCSSRRNVYDPTAPEEGSPGLLGPRVIKDETGQLPREVEGVTLIGEDGTIAYLNLTSDEGVIAWTYTPDPQVHDPTTSYWDALVLLYDGAAAGRVSSGDRDCNATTGNTISNNYLGGTVESDFGGSEISGKAVADQAFTFFDGARGANLATVAGNQISLNPFLGNETPIDGGAHPGRQVLAGPSWSGSGNWATTPQSVNRNTLQPQGAIYWTFYARLNVTDLEIKGFLIPGGGEDLFYGARHCAEREVGTVPIVQRGWTCDPSYWWGAQNYTGQTARARFSDNSNVKYSAPTLGWPYHLMDVECFDGTLFRGNPTRASFVDLATGPCEGAAPGDHPVPTE